MYMPKNAEFAPGNGRLYHSNPRASKADCIAAIELWTQTRRVAEALSVDEWAELDPGAKLVARDRCELEAIRHLLLKHPRESAMLGVFKAISFLSDERGYCDISQDRLARFFGRSREHINRCIQTLAADGVIKWHGENVAGKPARLYPVVARIFAGRGIHRTWFFDAFAPYESAKRWVGHVSAEKIKPWEIEGISRRTWFRRQKKANGQAHAGTIAMSGSQWRSSR